MDTTTTLPEELHPEGWATMTDADRAAYLTARYVDTLDQLMDARDRLSAVHVLAGAAM